jgi:hypothetical protein
VIPALSGSPSSPVVGTTSKFLEEHKILRMAAALRREALIFVVKD